MDKEWKHIVTVDTNMGREVICTILPLSSIVSLDTAERFVSEYKSQFPHRIYKIYKLIEVLHER